MRFSQLPYRLFSRVPHVTGWVAAASVILLIAQLIGCATPPARPENPPIADYEEIAVPPGATPRERIVDIALSEWQRWGSQTVQLDAHGHSCVTGSPLTPPALTINTPPAGTANKNNDDDNHDGNGTEFCPDFPDGSGAEATFAGCTLAQRYWRVVGKEPDCSQNTTGEWAWSAVFISWVMRKAHLDQRQFLTGDSHAHYVTDARDGILPAAAFTLQTLPAVPQVGDMVCAVRGSAVQRVHSPADIDFDHTPMHCDIVVAADRQSHTLQAIGGNVQQSVSMTTIPTDENGAIDYDENSVRPWLLILHNQLP